MKRWYVTYREGNKRRRRRIWKDDPGVFRAIIVSERPTDKARELTVKGEYWQDGEVKVDFARVRIAREATDVFVERLNVAT